MTKNILIISHSTFPSSHPRAMRTDELVKEMANQGHNVTLYVLTGNYDYQNYEQETNVKIKSLGNTYFSTYNHDEYTTLSFPAKVFNRLFGKYVEFPNIELIRNVYSALSKELSSHNEINLLITIAVPHPIHWSTAFFKSHNPEKFKNITWVADCGDPYMGNPFTTPPFYFQYIENAFCKSADFITVPTDTAIGAYPAAFRDKIRVIPQGFKLDSIKNLGYRPENAIPTFIYAGNFYPKLRDPTPLLEYLSTLDKDFKFIIYTKDSKIIEKYITKMESKLVVKPFIPRNEVLIELEKADFLINLENPSSVQSPSKLIDYAISGRPVLSINTNKPLDREKIIQFLNGNYANAYIFKDIEKYNIKNVVNNFLQLLNHK